MSRSSTCPARTPGPSTGSANLPPATILVVDSSAWILGMFTALLARLGYQIATATTGAAALTAVVQQRPAAVIADIRLPDMTVGELARAIRQYVQIPILLMTGGDDEVNSQALASVPAAVTLTKPFGIAEVQERLRACLPPPPAAPAAAGPESGTAGGPAQPGRCPPIARALQGNPHGDERTARIARGGGAARCAPPLAHASVGLA